MKRFSIIILFAASVLFVSCGSAVNLADTTTASISGAQCAMALSNLSCVYKNTGKLDLTNLTNLSNAAVVVQAASNLKQHKSYKAYQTCFVTGMLTGSNGNLTQAVANAMMTTLLNSANLTQERLNNASTKAQIAEAIINLLTQMN